MRPAVPVLARALALAWLPLLQRVCAGACVPEGGAAHAHPWHLPLLTALHAVLAHAPHGVRTPPALHLLERMCYPAALQSGLLLALAWLGVPWGMLWAAAAHAGACYAWDIQGAEGSGWWVRVCLAVSVLVAAPLLLLAHAPGVDALHPHVVLLALAFAEVSGALAASLLHWLPAAAPRS